ncbi:MAG: hypothetical protein ACI9FN_000303 [Saprospiraceae bacterium]|jgi:hypothetical protein
MNIKTIAIPLLGLLLLSCNADQPKNIDSSVSGSKNEQALSIEQNPNNNLYWGDTHLHTTNSPDAFSFGARLTPDDAYRFAKGESIESEGLHVQLKRPLDFLVVADHAEGIGLINEIMNENPALMKEPMLQEWSKNLQAGGKKAAQTGRDLINRFTQGNLPAVLTDRKVMGGVIKKVWTKYLTTTDGHYIPGKFTPLIGYEWSALPNGNNLHRVVVYRDDKDKAVQSFPVSSSLSNDPEDLWKALDAYEEKTGGKVLAIPHNGNASNGLMFTLGDYKGNPMTEAYANTRSRWEPIVETTQIKGDSESHPFLSPNDEFASYGAAGWDIGNLNLAELKTNKMFEFEYSRAALKNGLLLESQLGTNPFKFGMIGSTDSHTALATADSDNYSGKFTSMVADKKRALKVEEIGNAKTGNEGAQRVAWQYLASGYAAVWAKSNTREDIWDAMHRKEVYGTTGPRIQVRMFAGWDFTEDDINSADYVSRGYKKGVPMGSDLSPASGNKKAPQLMIAISKDPIGANLDRVQVIKGWLKDGKTHEKIYDIAWSNNRKKDALGKLPSVGNTVNVAEASYENSIGAKELTTVWTDPDFDSTLSAFYYLRVLEIPTPRWTTYDAARYDLDLPSEIPTSVQERAYSSPIWYKP